MWLKIHNFLISYPILLKLFFIGLSDFSGSIESKLFMEWTWALNVRVQFIMVSTIFPISCFMIYICYSFVKSQLYQLIDNLPPQKKYLGKPTTIVLILIYKTIETYIQIKNMRTNSLSRYLSSSPCQLSCVVYPMKIVRIISDAYMWVYVCCMNMTDANWFTIPTDPNSQPELQ